MTDQHSNLTPADLSADQSEVFRSILKWYESGASRPLKLGGLAGTGKTTLVSVLAKHLSDKARIAFCALTGKAAGVLRAKVTATLGADAAKHCSTIHSLLYKPVTNPKTGELIRYARKDIASDYSLIVVDEASMVSEDIYNDLIRDGVPLLIVGDHGQLPPVGGRFNLMERPDLRLEKIHRQAEGNPIIALAHKVRVTGVIPRDMSSNEKVRFASRAALSKELKAAYEGKSSKELMDIGVLCYKNATRQAINKMCRGLRFNGNVIPHPAKDDLVIALKNYKLGDKKDDSAVIFNGMRGVLQEPAAVQESGHHYKLQIFFPDEDVRETVRASKYQFNREKTISKLEELSKEWPDLNHFNSLGRLYDYGYALTVHKSQGSGFGKIILCYERPRPVTDEEFARWLYTAITRSSDNLVIVWPA